MKLKTTYISSIFIVSILFLVSSMPVFSAVDGPTSWIHHEDYPQIWTLWHPQYGQLVAVDIDQDDVADFYFDLLGNVYFDVDGDGVLDCKITKQGHIIPLYPGAPTISCIQWNDDHTQWGLDIDQDGICDFWKNLFRPSIYIDLNGDGYSDCIITPSVMGPYFVVYHCQQPSNNHPGYPYVPSISPISTPELNTISGTT